ncbi:MAG: UDP-N-acetylglucosamine 1-carboxyvinyltransferase [Roseburia sp.]|nr:UDP-N-acetylglucosamine 1-carboxyvinyltransferase [Roseburia sp.]MCM1099327.1 UDP-N-acetylglucosamine 1-carboxyvinyltransferase [Ruminococcus flavefaciens]
MDSISIQGGVALQGKVCIQGSKNAALPILAAAVLTGETTYLRNCPRIADVYAMASLLRNLGCTVSWQKDGILVDSARIRKGEMRSDAVTGMRSSLCMLGAMLGRCGEVVMEYPGGCVIGERPIDLHLAALERMGAVFRQEDGLLRASAAELHGAGIRLPRPSVGATENVILAGVMAEGETTLEGAAEEPEIGALCDYLRSCGARISREGGSLVIQGGGRLYGTEFTIPSDRIVAGTYLLACVGTGGNVFLENAPREELGAVLETAERMGACLDMSEQGIYVQGPVRPRAVDCIRTEPYPGFPTDLQSVALVVETLGDGVTEIEETIFENRFRILEELRGMGADLEQTDERRVRIRGVDALRGSSVTARELRGGAALVTAGLMASGKTTVTGCPYIYRGYENICRDFRELGARIIRV